MANMILIMEDIILKTKSNKDDLIKLEAANTQEVLQDIY